MEQKNEKIYYSCERVRAFLCLNAADYSFIHFGSEFRKIVDLVQKGSEINSLIEQHKWTELFKKEEWLNLLFEAENLSFLRDVVLNTELITIAENFPEETSKHIFLEPLRKD